MQWLPVLFGATALIYAKLPVILPVTTFALSVQINTVTKANNVYYENYLDLRGSWKCLGFVIYT